MNKEQNMIAAQAQNAEIEKKELNEQELENVNGGIAITPDVIRRDYQKAHRNK